MGRLPDESKVATPIVVAAEGDSQAIDPIETEPLYTQALLFMQLGKWAEAKEALASLIPRHPGSTELQGMKESLALHLSAEQTWANQKRQRLLSSFRHRSVRVLFIANLLLYFTLGIILLLKRS